MDARPDRTESAGLTPSLRSKLLPFTLAAAVILLDQITKAMIVASIDPYTIGASFLDGFLRIIHARNLGIAFSIGRDLPEEVRRVFFVLLPLAVLAFVAVYYFRTDELSSLQRWSIAGIIGGGVGNLIDRIFRPAGVVDFIDVRFYGIFGFERWPTFNVADSSVVVCGVLLMLTFLLPERKER